MPNTDQASFENFASAFVHAYWQTVKSGDFPMPPNEAIEETLEELLSAVSYSTDVQTPEISCKLLMTGQHGDWWHFAFRGTDHGWSLVGCSARSDDDSNPHDLLGPVYSRYFGPFLRHVTKVANSDNRI